MLDTRVRLILNLSILFVVCGIAYVFGGRRFGGRREYMTNPDGKIECKTPHNASDEAKKMICDGQHIGMQNRENAKYDSEIDTSKLK